jgi:hypothetical protein
MDRFLRAANLTLGILASLIGIAVVVWPTLFPPATQAVEQVVGAIVTLQNRTISYLLFGAIALMGFFFLWTVFTMVVRLIRNLLHDYAEDDYWFRSSYRADVEGSKRLSAWGGLALVVMTFTAIGFLAVDPELTRDGFGWTQSEPGSVLILICAICGIAVVLSVFRRS